MKNKQDINEVAGVFLSYLKVLLTYNAVAVAQKEGKLTSGDIRIFKQHFDPVAKKVADKVQDIYDKTMEGK